jgi:hypothetical protein
MLLTIKNAFLNNKWNFHGILQQLVHCISAAEKSTVQFMNIIQVLLWAKPKDADHAIKQVQKQVHNA